MNPQMLREHLRKLHDELGEGPEVDDRTRTLLLEVLDDIHGLLDRPSPPVEPPDPASLATRLRDATWHLEESHPKLTTVVSQLLDALSRPFQ